MAALGRLDLSPRAVIISFVAGVVLVGVVLFTGARADRIGASVSSGVNDQLAGMGLALNRVHITGASDEARPAIQAAIDLTQGQPITAVDLDAVRASVEDVGWVRSARVVRLLPDTVVVAVTEHDRLAVWQTGGRNYVVDSTGQVIPGADPGRYPRLPLVVGTGAAEAASDILPLLRQRPRLMTRVEALVRVDERRWDVRLRNGGVIQLPRPIRRRPSSSWTPWTSASVCSTSASSAWIFALPTPWPCSRPAKPRGRASCREIETNPVRPWAPTTARRWWPRWTWATPRSPASS
ncbi:cell division protein FtsQ/DivIB [Brevundimonas denitrificans]|uniref:cell division protein FtsQ/DivIB n=1 Tax=Brevundimonas denitrificans TaxID=1443434 RepID=UPI00223AD2F5|nr:cell division protein FtsQ/DivIB [Brevundimonas denitrificans]